MSVSVANDTCWGVRWMDQDNKHRLPATLIHLVICHMYDLVLLWLIVDDGLKITNNANYGTYRNIFILVGESFVLQDQGCKHLHWYILRWYSGYQFNYFKLIGLYVLMASVNEDIRHRGLLHSNPTIVSIADPVILFRIALSWFFPATYTDRKLILLFC